MTADYKQRSFAQRVGTAGELQYRLMAVRQHLTATKIEEDFGLDFVSQAEATTDAKSANAVIPTAFGVCVRASQAASGRIKLNQKDAANLLRSQQPLVLVLPHLVTEVAPCYYRFVDADFGARLSEFLDSGNDEMTMTPNDCRPEKSFRSDLMAALRPGATRRTQIALAQLRIKSLVRGATVKIQIDQDDEIAIILADDYFDFFEQLPEVQRNSVYRAAFGRPDLFRDRSTQFQFKSAIPEAFLDAPRKFVIGGALVSDPTVLEVSGTEGVASAAFTYTRIGTHYGWVHDNGLALTVSASKAQPDGTMIHETRVLLDDEADCALDDIAEDLRGLLIAAIPDAILRDTTGSFAMEVDYFQLPKLCEVVRAHADARSLPGWDPTAIQLRDLEDAGTRRTTMFLGTWAVETALFPNVNFYVSVDADPVNLDDAQRVRSSAAVTVVLDTLRATIVATVTGSATELWHDGELVGLAGFEARSVELDTSEPIGRDEVHPEIVLAPNLSLVLDPAGTRFSRTPPWVEGFGYRTFTDEPTFEPAEDTV